MTVLSVAYPLFPVGADSGGGAEQILFLLEREIVRAGHRSLVIAAKGSEVSGELIETSAAAGEITEAVRCRAQSEHLETICKLLRITDVDVIHFHGLDFAAYVPLPVTPVSMLATLHLPISWYSESTFKLDRVQLVCVSQSQSAGTDRYVVCNGVDLNRFGGVSSTSTDYLLWLGRICPEKGVHIALRVAHALDMKMMVVGPVHAFETHQQYFCEQVSPLLDSKRSYLGSVGGEAKVRLLQEARCLVVPSVAAETSSLVAMEAMSTGTPVVAFRSGALPEIVEHGVTGYIVDSESQMAEAVEGVYQISRAACREVARRRFDSRRMAAEYLRLYEAMISVQSERGSGAVVGHPRTI
jgi:glycosyltransferase involved in cell wall biosynthesis